MKFIAISWMTFAQTGSILMVGGVLTVTIVPGIILTPIIGVLVDRFDRRIFAMIIEFLQGAVLFCWVYLLNTKGFNVQLLYLFTGLLAIGQSVTMPALFALLPELFTKDRILKINSLISIASQGGYLVGSSLGGFIVAYIHSAGALFVNALTYLVSGFTLLFLRKGVVLVNGNAEQDAKQVEKPVPRMIADLVQTFTHMKQRGDVRVLVVMGISTWLVAMVMNVLLAPFTSQALKTDTWGFGLLDAVVGIGAIIGGLLVPLFKKWYKKQIIGIGFFLIGLLLFLFGTNNFLLIALALNLILGIVLEATGTLVDTFIQLRVDIGFLGRISSMIRLGGSIFGPLFMCSAAALAQYGTYLLAFGSMAVYMCIIGFFACLWGSRYELDLTFELYSNVEK
ncbi:MAG: MFS transporter [Alicyclobacillus sp.]|nr:MFS transporter [Alicyclobacillus sp.]